MAINGFTKPELGRGGEADHGEVGADLDDGVDIVAVERADGVAALGILHFGDAGP